MLQTTPMKARPWFSQNLKRRKTCSYKAHCWSTLLSIDGLGWSAFLLSTLGIKSRPLRWKSGTMTINLFATRKAYLKIGSMEKILFELHTIQNLTAYGSLVIAQSPQADSGAKI